MTRKATAVWQGNLKEGKGVVSTQSGVLKQASYSFHTRFENGAGTNPEELLAAAHAACFAMALSNELGKAGIEPVKLEATAEIILEKKPEGFSITKSHIDLVAHIPGVDADKFHDAVNSAKIGCPVSKLYKAEISVSAQLHA